jgi:hypothetical protein
MAGTKDGSKNNGGRRKGAGRKKGDRNNRGRAGQSPRQFMNALVVAGPRVDHDRPEAEFVEAEAVDADFTKKMEYVDPVEFCQAVINSDQEILTKCGVLQIPTLEDKLMAAKVAVPYTNKKKPVETISKHQFSWLDEISEAENRLRTKRMNTEEFQHDHAPKSVN